MRTDPMAIRPFEQHTPQIHATVHVDDTALVIGDVEIGEDSSIWPMSVIRGDIQRIRIGARTSIQDGSVIHVTHDSRFCPGGQPTLIGNDVTVGHKVIPHACTIEDYCLIGMGSIIMDKAVVRSRVTIGAGSVVPPGKVLESGFLCRQPGQASPTAERARVGVSRIFGPELPALAGAAPANDWRGQRRRQRSRPSPKPPRPAPKARTRRPAPLKRG